jgi:hypothetical protein
MSRPEKGQRDKSIPLYQLTINGRTQCSKVKPFLDKAAFSN